jgi:iron complex outermembrane receptor protein
MKHIILVGLLCLTQWHIVAQNQLTLKDKETNQSLPFVDIYFPNTKTTTITDNNGNFIIDATQKSVLVQISMLGYEAYLQTINPFEVNTIFLTPSVHTLSELVVSASSSKLQNENVVNVKSINLLDNPELHGISLVQQLSSMPGVSNFSTGSGIGKPVIRGLSGNRIAVFSQGVRVENQQWGDEHGLGLDENGYRQVEVIKGPASLLYGSDALGGVLYFVDERYAKKNSLEGILNSEYNTNTNGWRNTAGLKMSKGKLHWNLFGGYTTHEDYRDGDKERVENSRFNTSDFKTVLGYTGNKFITSLKYNFLNEKYGLTEIEEESESYRNGRKPDFPYQDLTTHLVSSENAYFFDNNSKLNLVLGYIFNNRKEFEEENPENEADLNMNLSTLSYNAKWSSEEKKEGWSWIAGSQGMYQTNRNNGEEMLIPDAATIDLGVYATTDFYYTPDSYWQIGMRFDQRKITGEEHGQAGEDGYFPSFDKIYPAVNFSTGVYQKLSKFFSMRASLSSGFRAPNMFELLSDGVHEGTNRYEIGNPDLKTENSYQIDFSLDGKTTHWEFFVNPYYNYIRNYIFLQPTGEIKEDLPVYDYTQSDAYLLGGEAGFHFHPYLLKWMYIEASYSTTYGKDTDGNDLPLIPSSKINASVNGKFSIKKALDNLSFFLQYQYSFEQSHIADYETSTPAYSLLNAGVRLGFKYFSFDVNVNNVFDMLYYDHLSRYKNEGIYNIGRNVVFKLSIPVNVKL